MLLERSTYAMRIVGMLRAHQASNACTHQAYADLLSNNEADEQKKLYL